MEPACLFTFSLTLLTIQFVSVRSVQFKPIVVEGQVGVLYEDVVSAGKKSQ
jgi:hypothetical protein